MMSDETETQAADRSDVMRLGLVLQEARLARGLSLRAAARAAKVSPMQLSRLERGESKKPSPHMLYQLGQALNLPYADLMRLAGYAAPTGSGDEEASATMDDALGAEGLLLRAAAPFTDDELQAMLAFLRFYRQRNSAHIQPHASEVSDDRAGATTSPGRPRRKQAPRASAPRSDHAS
jgi:transcriptional regulator with XRE-family HTH domain